MPAINAQDACVLPSPASLDCYYGATTPDAPQSFPPSWCTTIQNNHWFAFTADAVTASFDISCYGCATGNGIQAAVLSSADCINFQFVSPCLGNIATQTTQTLTTNVPLTPGQVYYLCIDGSGGAQCDYSINGGIPTVNGPVSGACIPSDANDTYTTSAPSSWTINPIGAGNFTGSSVGTSVTVHWTQPGAAQVCATNNNCPNAPAFCLDVFVGEDVMTEEDYTVCQGHAAECAGKTYTTAGSYNVHLDTYTGCDSLVRCNIHIVPPVTTDETHLLCQGQTVDCAGQPFGFPGTFNVTLENYQGCDSIVKCKIVLIPTTISPFTAVTMCGPAQYQLCQNFYTSSGLYTEICTSIMGCDSIVNVNLAILEPVAVIAPPATIDCDVNSTITIDGSGSSVNTAVGGTTLYKWSGPGIIGANNQPTVQANQPGQYCLIVTHGRAGINCSDTACVNVNAISAVPQLPLISGNGSPCQDSTILYTATSVGNPPPTSFNWTTPGNYPYTQISPDSIRITWDSVFSGQLCVTAANSCGASAPACLPVAVQPAVLVPVVTGPGVVCAGGGLYTYSVDSLQPGTTYTWTVPTGALMTVDSNTVLHVDFLNAVSGQVCLKAQNVCGSKQVCQNVQVMPIPTAHLASDAVICAGDTVALTFTLSGNGPFDVSWTNGTQTSTLNDIANGHVVKVSPAQNTGYRLLSVGDNTVPSACTATANDSVTVTVWQHTSLSQAFEICDGQTMLLGGAQQSTSGVYVDSLQTIHGCDSIVTSTLTVHAIDSLVVQLTTCDPAAAGTTTLVLSQANGCDSIVTTIVTLLPSDTTLLFDKSCDLNNVGVFTQNLTNVYGCDSTVITTVTFSLSDTTLVSGSSCDPAAAGVFMQHLVTTDGCDSLIITTIALLASDTILLSGSSCNPAEVGVFTQNLFNQNGCDSTVITTITFFHTDTTFLAAASCDPAAVGTFTQILVTAAGCDSVIVTTVTLLPSDTTQLSGSSCNPAEVGVFTDVLTNQWGCDSTVITTISFFHLDTTYLSATSCDPAAVGVFPQTLVTAQGCDSVIITTVTLLPSNTTLLTGSSCNPAEVGVFTQNLSNQYGCDSTVITTVSFFHLDSTFLTASSCNPAEVGVFSETLTTPQGCDSVIITTVSFFHLDTTYLTATTCDPAGVGVFPQTLTTLQGCDSVIITTVTLLPSNQVAIQSTTCDPAAAGVFTYNLFNQYGCDSTVTETVLLLPHDTTYLFFTTCDQAQVGIVHTILTNQWGCDSTIVSETTLLPPASCGVTATLAGSNIPCGSNTGSLTLTATLGEAPFDYTILLGGTPVSSGTFNAVGLPQVVSGLAAGNYTVNLASANGFSTTAQASIIQLVPPGLVANALSNYNGFAISCHGETDGSVQAVTNGGLPPFQFLWSNGGITQQLSNIGIGTYTVTVTDAHACTNVASVTLGEPEPLIFGFVVNDLDCFGQHDGAIFIEATGGVPPYRYSSDNAHFQASNTFLHLNAGTYTVTTLDANDCQSTETIIVNPAVELSVDLGDDITILQGDSTDLEAIVNVPLDSLLSVVWTPAFDSTDCPSCLAHVVAPLVSTSYAVRVTALNGCSDEDNIIVRVDRTRFIYAPNVFSPGSEGDNDKFRIYAKAGTVKQFKNFQVFDRWGESVYRYDEFLPNDPKVGWDGRFRGNVLSPAVFVWSVEVEFIDGVKEVLKGDVTLFR